MTQREGEREREQKMKKSENSEIYWIEHLMLSLSFSMSLSAVVGAALLPIASHYFGITRSYDVMKETNEQRRQALCVCCCCCCRCRCRCCRCRCCCCCCCSRHRRRFNDCVLYRVNAHKITYFQYAGQRPGGRTLWKLFA